jgi:hypothetical protein
MDVCRMQSRGSGASHALLSMKGRPIDDVLKNKVDIVI